jgi:hypothetical protein
MASCGMIYIYISVFVEIGTDVQAILRFWESLFFIFAVEMGLGCVVYVPGFMLIQLDGLRWIWAVTPCRLIDKNHT